MTDTELTIIKTLHHVTMAVSNLTRVLRDQLDSRDIDFIERELDAASRVAEPLMDALTTALTSVNAVASTFGYPEPSDPQAGPTPSSDDKTPPSPTVGENSGTLGPMEHYRDLLEQAEKKSPLP